MNPSIAILFGVFLSTSFFDVSKADWTPEDCRNVGKLYISFIEDITNYQLNRDAMILAKTAVHQRSIIGSYYFFHEGVIAGLDIAIGEMEGKNLYDQCFPDMQTAAKVIGKVVELCTSLNQYGGGKAEVHGARMPGKNLLKRIYEMAFVYAVTSPGAKNKIQTLREPHMVHVNQMLQNYIADNPGATAIPRNAPLSNEELATAFLNQCPQ